MPRGVYLTSTGALTRHARAQAGLLRAGADSVLAVGVGVGAGAGAACTTAYLVRDWLDRRINHWPPKRLIRDSGPMSVDTDRPATRVVPLTTQDAERLKALEEVVWFEVAQGLTAEQLTEDLDFDATFGVEVDGPAPAGVAPDRLVGAYTAYDMAVTVPGPGTELTRLPMSGLSWVGVHPDQRRRGILTQMMTHHLHGVKEAGVTPLAGLHASEPEIYGRFGYGLSSVEVQVQLGRGSSFTVPEQLDTAATQVQTHFVPASTNAHLLHRAHLDTAGHRLGAVTRGDHQSLSWFNDFPKMRGSKEPMQVMFAARGGQTTGYAVFRRESKWSDDGKPEGKVAVREMAATDAASLLALARRLVDFDLTATVEADGRALDDPLYLWAGGPRTVTVRVFDSLWLRLVDVPGALTARGYAAPVDVVLDVVDELCPWNARSWRLVVGADGVASCEPSQAEAQLRLPVAALGAAYLGSRSIATMLATGQVSELAPGAATALSRAMRADTEPVGAIGF